jgi:hypothetical protein
MSLITAINSETTPLNSVKDFSSANGSFQIIFEITGSANQLIDLSSIRLLCEASFLNSAKQHFNNTNIYSQAITNPAGGDFAITAPIAYDSENNPYYDIDCRTGVTSCISNIQFMDSESNILESVYNYPHLISKISGMSMSKDDQVTWGSSLFGVKSGGKQLQNQTALNSNYSLALKLYSGLLQSDPIPFSVLKGKLRIVITLNNPSSVLFGGNNTGLVRGVGTTFNPAQGSYFNLNDVRLTYRTLVLPENAPIMKEYTYKHFSSLNSTIVSSNSQNVYTPNTTNTISILTSFIRSQALNSYSANSIQSNKLQKQSGATGFESVDIHNLNFLKNNIRFPNQFSIDERVYNKNNNGLSNYDTQRSYYYMSTLTSMSKLNKTLIQSSTESNDTLQCGSFDETSSPDFNVPVYGVGVKYANVSGEDGSSFVNGASFLQRIESGLVGDTVNEQFTNVLATRTIIPSVSGAVILQ